MRVEEINFRTHRNLSSEDVMLWRGEIMQQRQVSNTRTKPTQNHPLKREETIFRFAGLLITDVSRKSILFISLMIVVIIVIRSITRKRFPQFVSI